jgi:hypothetical protein
MSGRLGILTQRLVDLPRLVRVLIVAFFAVMATLALMPLVDHIYIRFFYTAETVMVPSLVTVALASIMYIGGWWIYIGTVHTTPPARRRVLWYFAVGIAVTIIVIVLLIMGVSILNLPD